MVYVIPNNPKALPRCGGTILSEDRILSVAHCFWNADKTQSFELDFEVVAGAHSFWVKNSNWQELKVT